MKTIPVGKSSTKRKSMIAVRGGFSDQNGFDTVNTAMQYDDIDDRTRVLLSNELYDIIQTLLEETNFDCAITPSNAFCKEVISEVFNQRNNLSKYSSYDWEKIFEAIHQVIIQAPINEVLDIVWFVCNWFANHSKYRYVVSRGYEYEKVNSLFEKEYVGYRFVNGEIVSITDKTEISEIEQACKREFDGCKIHIQKAVAFLADREVKDYKNCVKESISAVESICKVITQNEHATLGDALKELEKKRGLKGPLKVAFEKLYSYTNDKGGVRHADGLFVSEVSFEEAKFMLVSCSAFVNYLISEYGKIK